MDMDPDDLKRERLKLPSEKEEEKKKSRQGGSQLLFKVLSIGALLLGLVLVFFLMRMDQRHEARGQELSDQIDELKAVLSLVSERLDEDRQLISSLTTDVGFVQKRLGLTQNEIRKARAVAETLRKEQEKDVKALSDQILRKADSQQVVELDEKSETQFREVGEQIKGVQEDVKASRQELENTVQELAAIGLRVSEQGSLIATTGDALEELKRRGEREYIQFVARKKKKITVGDILLELRKADRKKHRADLRLYYDDKKVDQKKVYTNTPLTFYVGREKIHYELVINEVTKDRIRGYVSVPLGKLPKPSQLGTATAK